MSFTKTHTELYHIFVLFKRCRCQNEKQSQRNEIQSPTVPTYIFVEFIDLPMRYRKLK